MKTVMLIKKFVGLLSIMVLVTLTAFGRSPVTVTSGVLPSGVVSTPYSASFRATGGSAPYSWAITGCSGACNTGLGFNPSSGTLFGTPANAGTTTFTVRVSDANAQVASGSFNIAIAAANQPTSTPPAALAVTSPSTLPNGVVSTAYSTSLKATGGTAPYSWAIAGCSGACNTGLGLVQAGVFSGTPTNAGTSTYAVKVTDASANTASASLNITITPAGTSTGNTLYVSPSGSDSNPCGQSSPCATPDHAFGIASPGDTVQVDAGTYDYGSSAAQFTNSGTSGKYITVTCATRGACKIQNSVTGNSTVVYLSGSYITFDGFEVTNTSSAGNNLGFYVTSSFVNITHNTIHHIETDCGSNGGGGIQIAGSGSSNSDLHNITIDGNLIYDINYRGGSPSCTSSTVQSDGILAETAGTGLIVTNNVVYHTSGGWGILVGNSNATFANVNSVIANNTVFSTTGGIIIVSGNGTTISNNIVSDTGQQSGRCGISAPQQVSVTYANNDLWNNAGGSYCLEWGTSDQSVHSNDISVDPALGTTFVNWQADGSGDYHEKAGSPTIGKGNSTLGPPPTIDFDGKSRQGAGDDIGAYQF
jgi:parallel beta-helix repeat protein